MPPQLFSAMSTRQDGSMRLEHTDNRTRFLQQHKIDRSKVVSAELCHGKNVAFVNSLDATTIPKTDALVTTNPDVYLSITVADCVPITLFDSENYVLGLVHAGWRGLQQKIISEAVANMQQKGANSEKITAIIGPHIGACHYEVGEEVSTHFNDIQNAVNSKNYLDLHRVTQFQLENSGIAKSSITHQNSCTFCNSETYFSYRKDQNDPVQVMMVVAGMR